MDDPSGRVDKTDGRNVQNEKTVLHIIAHSFAHTSPTEVFDCNNKYYFIKKEKHFDIGR